MVQKDVRVRKISLGIWVLIFVIMLLLVMAWYINRAVRGPPTFREQKLVVGCTDNFPPFDLRDKSGDHIGYARDISTEVARELGYVIEYRTSPRWVEVVEWLKNGKVDLLHLIAYSPERDEYFDFTIPHTLVPEVIFVRSKRLDIHGLDNLEDKQIGAVRRHITHEKLLKYEGLNILVFETPQEGVEALLDGKVDAFAYPEYVFEYLVQQMGREDEIKIVGEPLGNLRYGMAVRGGDHVLLSRLDRAIKQIETSGQRDEIARRWFGRKVFLGLTREEILSLIGWAVFGLLVTSLGGLAYISVRYKLRKTEAVMRHNLIFQQMDDSVILISLDGKITDWNPRAERMFGYSREEILGQSLDFLLAPEGSTELFETIIREVQDEGIWLSEIRAARKDGSQVVCSVKATALRNEKGNIIAYTSIIRDITELKQAEDHIQHLQSVLKAIRDVNQLIVHEKNQKKLLQGACETLNQTRNYKLVWIGLIKEGTKDVLPAAQAGFDESYLKSIKITWDDSETGKGPTGTAIKTRKPFVMRDIAVDPRYKPWRVEAMKCGYASSVATPLVYENRVFGALNVYAAIPDSFDEEETDLLLEVSQDIAFALHNIEVEEKRKRAEEALYKAHEELEAKVAERTKELAQANIQLKELDRLKSEFFATMSHELRTPLNSIIGFTGIILQGKTGEINEEQRKQLSMVYSSGKHLLSLINDILNLTRIESSKMEVSMDRFRIQDVISEVSQSFSPMISQKGLQLITEIPDTAPEIYSDRKKVLQVLLNLVSNAVKFTEIGEARIECKFDSNNLEVSVSDTGIGIKKENMDLLFEAFRQGSDTAQRRYEGAGLGLHLCQKLVTLLGGKIWAESEYGKGSIFTFTLPIRLKERGTT